MPNHATVPAMYKEQIYALSIDAMDWPMDVGNERIMPDVVRPPMPIER